MRRRLLIVVCGAAALVAAPPAHAVSSTKLTSVKLLSCSEQTQSAIYQAGMTAVPGADRMALRYTLLRTSLNGELRVRVPGLGRWHRSKPGVRTYVWKQELLNLAAGGSYRVRVDYRWFAPDGTIVRSEQRRSLACRQLSSLPNLRVQVLSAAPTMTDGVVRYRIELRNDGTAPASGAELRFAVDGAVIDTQVVSLLAPGEYRVVAVRGPVCTRWVDSSADPDNGLVESSETDNTHSLACADLAPG